MALIVGFPCVIQISGGLLAIGADVVAVSASEVLAAKDEIRADTSVLEALQLAFDVLLKREGLTAVSR